MLTNTNQMCTSLLTSEQSSKNQGSVRNLSLQILTLFTYVAYINLQIYLRCCRAELPILTYAYFFLVEFLVAS